MGHAVCRQTQTFPALSYTNTSSRRHTQLNKTPEMTLHGHHLYLVFRVIPVQRELLLLLHRETFDLRGSKQQNKLEKRQEKHFTNSDAKHACHKVLHCGKQRV